MEELQPQTPQPELTVAQRLERSLKREAGEEWTPPQTEPAETTEEPQQAAEQTETTEETQEPEGQPAESGVAEVELNGKTYQVPAEIKDGYLRQADYTKKTQALAEDRKYAEALKAEAETAYKAVQALGPVIAGWHQLNDKIAEYDKVDYQSLWNAGPEGQAMYTRLKMEQQEARQSLAALSGQLQQAPTLLNQLDAKAHAAEVARNLPLVKEWVPDLDKRRDELFETGKKYGYSDQELSMMSNARDVRALRDLAEYQKIIAKRDSIKQQVTAAPPVARPGTRTVAPSAQKDYNAALKVLKSGDRSDDAFLNALRAQRKLTG